MEWQTESEEAIANSLSQIYQLMRPGLVLTSRVEAQLHSDNNPPALKSFDVDGSWAIPSVLPVEVWKNWKCTTSAPSLASRLLSSTKVIWSRSAWPFPAIATSTSGTLAAGQRGTLG